MRFSGGLICLAVRLTVILSCCCCCHADDGFTFMEKLFSPFNESPEVPINTSQDLLEEELVDLRRNLSEVWQILGDYQSRLEKLEGLEPAGNLCGEDGSDSIAPEELDPATPVHDKETGDHDQRRWKDGDPEEEPEEDEEDDEDDNNKDRDHKNQRHRQQQRHRDDDERGSTSGGSQHSDRKFGPKNTRQDSRGSGSDCHHHHHYGHGHEQHHRNRNTDRTGSGCANAGAPNRGYRNRLGSGGYQPDKSNVTAYCSMRPNKAIPQERRVDIRGKIYLSQEEGSSLTMSIKVSGFQKPGNQSTEVHHGFHVHEFGNLTNGCESTGSHYNPYNTTHGGHPRNSTDFSKRHLGDFGNIDSDQYGIINETLTFDMENALSGPNSIIGKTLVIHEKTDDLGSKPEDPGSMSNGNAGSRLACCIIYKLH